MEMNYRLLVLALATFGIGTDNYVVAGILPQVAQSFDVTAAAAGQFVTAYSLSYAIATPLLATLTANWSRRRVLVAGLIIFIAGNILTVMQHLFPLALISRAIAGAGAAIVTPAAGAAAAAIVKPEQRGRALALVLAGLSAATAFGAPIGTLVANFGDWRTTIWFVAAIGLVACGLIWISLPALSSPAHMTLRERLAPLTNPGIRAALLTTFVPMFGIFMVYTYISLVFAHATAGDGARLAMLLSVWGVGATVGILCAGRLSDRFGSRRVINFCLAAAASDFALMPWTSAGYASALPAMAVWGMFGWGFVLSQQHRLVSFSPALAPVLIALNASAIYLAVSASSAFGAILLRAIDARLLPLIAAALIASALVSAERAFGRLALSGT
jgi:MFS transporter, DHA1 family, inner membrane transport protein